MEWRKKGQLVSWTRGMKKTNYHRKCCSQDDATMSWLTRESRIPYNATYFIMTALLLCIHWGEQQIELENSQAFEKTLGLQRVSLNCTRYNGALWFIILLLSTESVFLVLYNPVTDRWLVTVYMKCIYSVIFLKSCLNRCFQAPIQTKMQI